MADQCLIGIKGKNFAMLASDQIETFFGFIMKNDADRLYTVNNRLIMGMNGEQGDVQQFTQYIKTNVALYELRNGYHMDNKAVVHFTRNVVTDYLKRPKPVSKVDIEPTLNLSFIIGGWDKYSGGQMYSIDYLGSSTPVEYAAHGIGGLLCYSILAMHHRPDIEESKAYEIIHLCVNEIRERLFLNLPEFKVKVVTSSGVTTLPILRVGPQPE